MPLDTLVRSVEKVAPIIGNCESQFPSATIRSAFGGLLLAQLLTLYTTPVVYLYLDRLRARWEEGPAEHVRQPDGAMVG